MVNEYTIEEVSEMFGGRNVGWTPRKVQHLIRSGLLIADPPSAKTLPESPRTGGEWADVRVSEVAVAVFQAIEFKRPDRLVNLIESALLNPVGSDAE